MTDERRKRIHYHMYETCEGIAEHAERIVKLEDVAKEMLEVMQVMDKEWCSLPDFETVHDAAQVYDFDAKNAPEYEEKLRELGIEVS